ncbi:UbiH/UbiF/VisC/COQ6 family ubiquinone biosynthesis hydroxylase [Thermaurantiacus sp.]
MAGVTIDTEVLIVGGGLVGQTLALALARHDIASVVVERDDPEAHLTAAFDGRASAIASASGRMLEVLGLGPLLAADGCPIRAIEVAEGLSPEVVHFVAEEGGEPLGTMVENRRLRAALLDAVRTTPGISLLAPASLRLLDRGAERVTAELSTGATVRAALLVAADGRRSALREAAGLRIARWDYPGSAIVSMLTHTRPHRHVALELFYPTGPLAILPMRDLPDGRHRSAIVWTLPRARAAAVTRLGPRGFAAEVERHLSGRLGAAEPIAPAVAWPLGFHHAERYGAERLVLVGDSAHGIHPIAGQGLNLGFRDVAALTAVLAEGVRTGLDPGDPALIARYERWRRFDNSLTAFATDTLSRLFGLPGAPMRAIRRFGLGLVERLPPAKRLFAAIARGTAGDLPPLLRGELA